MTKFVGRLGALGIAVESSRGTPVAPTYWLPRVSMSFFDRTTVQREEQGLGKVADSDSLFVTMRSGEGDVEAQLYDIGLGYILTSLLGDVPSSSGGNPYTHTYTFSNSNQQKSLSLYWQDPNLSLMFPLAVVESLTISVEPGGMVEYTMSFRSKAAKDWARLTPTYATLGNKFLHQHTQFRLADTVGALSAASALNLKSLELTLARNSAFDEVIGTAEPVDVLGQQFSVEGSLELNNEDNTYRGYMLNGTYKAAELQLFRSSSSSMTLQFPRVDFTQWEPDYSLNEISTQSINVKANYDVANDLDIISTATVINAKASY